VGGILLAAGIYLVVLDLGHFSPRIILWIRYLWCYVYPRFAITY